MNETLSLTPNIKALTSAASRSFGRIVNIFKQLKNMGIKTYETLYTTYVLPIMNYSSGVWGFKEYSQPQVLQNRVARFYMGVHRFTSVAVTQIELDWLDMRSWRWSEMIRLYNRIKGMKDNRIPVRIHKWDTSLDTDAWAKEISFILEHADMLSRYDNEDTVYLLGILRERLLESCITKY